MTSAARYDNPGEGEAPSRVAESDVDSRARDAELSVEHSVHQTSQHQERQEPTTHCRELQNQAT